MNTQNQGKNKLPSVTHTAAIRNPNHNKLVAQWKYTKTFSARCVDFNGDRYYVVADLCKAFGFANSQAFADYCPNQTYLQALVTTDDVTERLIITDKSGLLALLQLSPYPKANDAKAMALASGKLTEADLQAYESFSIQHDRVFLKGKIIRTVARTGVWWFPYKDVCLALNYVYNGNTFAKFNNGNNADVDSFIVRAASNGKLCRTTMVNENNVALLIRKSPYLRLAQELKQWLLDRKLISEQTFEREAREAEAPQAEAPQAEAPQAEAPQAEALQAEAESYADPELALGEDDQAEGIEEVDAYEAEALEAEAEALQEEMPEAKRFKQWGIKNGLTILHEAVEPQPQSQQPQSQQPQSQQPQSQQPKANSLVEIFTFDAGANKHPIRTVQIDGNPWLVGKDVCDVLGYANASDALNQHCRGVAKRYPIVDRLGRTQEVRIINEPDTYRLITSSRLPEAKRFEKWLFEEVLPSIRKTGSYHMGQEQQSPEADDQTYGDQAYGDPAYGDPAYGDQVYGDPAYGDQVYGDPAYGDHPRSRYGKEHDAYMAKLQAYTVKQKLIFAKQREMIEQRHIARLKQIETKVAESQAKVAESQAKAAESQAKADVLRSQAEVVRQAIDIARGYGFTGNHIALSADRVVTKVLGFSPLEIMGGQLVADPRGRTYNPTELGQMFDPKISAQQVNKLLAKANLQTWFNDVWNPTKAAEGLYEWIDTGKVHNDGAPVKQLRWFTNVMHVLVNTQTAVVTIPAIRALDRDSLGLSDGDQEYDDSEGTAH